MDETENAEKLDSKKVNGEKLPDCVNKKLKNLPDEVIREIIDRMMPSQVMTVQLVNKTWQRLAIESLANRVESIELTKHDRRNSQFPNSKMYAIHPVGHRSKQLKTLEILVPDGRNHATDLTRRLNNILPLIQQLINVTCLKVWSVWIDASDLANVISRCSKLEQLFIYLHKDLLSSPAWDSITDQLSNQLTRFGVFMDSSCSKTTYNQLAQFFGACQLLDRVDVFSQYPNDLTAISHLIDRVFVNVNYYDFDKHNDHNVTAMELLAKRADQLAIDWYNLDIVSEDPVSKKKFERLSHLTMKNHLSSSGDEIVYDMPQLKTLEIFADDLAVETITKRFGVMDKLEELVVFDCAYEDEEFGLLLGSTPNITKLVLKENFKILHKCNRRNSVTPSLFEIPNQSLTTVTKLRSFELRAVTLKNDGVENVVKLLQVLKEMPELAQVILDLVVDELLADNIQLMVNAFAELGCDKPKIDGLMRLWVKPEYDEKRFQKIRQMACDKEMSKNLIIDCATLEVI